jgi:hypothetical protein
MVDLLDNFLNLLELFPAVVNDSTKMLIGVLTKNGQG